MRRVTGRAARCGVLCLVVAWTGSGAGAEDVPQPPRTSQQIMAALVANEEAAAEHKHHYSYLSEERSDRTGGHLWTEKVVETNLGNVTMRLAEDGKPLSAERVAQERGRLAGIVADPAGFARRSQSQKDDEVHARQMLLLVQRAFLFSEVREEPGYLRIDFRPNPAYSTQSLEERVLHGMSGTMLIDPQRLRLHSIEARLPQDVNIGYGLLATVHTGSSLTGDACWHG